MLEGLRAFHDEVAKVFCRPRVGSTVDDELIHGVFKMNVGRVPIL